MSRATIVIEPAANGSIDFQRRQWDSSQIWLQYPKAAWLPTMLPAAISEAAGGNNLVFSTFRRFPLCDPADFALSNEPGILTRLFAPLGGNWPPDMWVCLHYYDPRQPPVAGQERFYASSGGLKRLLSEAMEAPAFIDSMRTLDKRPRLEVLVRHDLRAIDLAPNAIEAPGWMKQVEGLSPEEAAGRMNSLRAPTSNAQWYQIRAQDRAQRERAATKPAAEPEAPTQPEEPAEAPEAAQPVVLTMEEKRTLVKRKERMARATQSKVRADQFNRTAAAKHAARVVDKLERAGKL